MRALRELRRGKNITQGKLSELLGVSRSTISMWEIDASEPDYEMIKRIADMFNVTTDYLLGRTDEPNHAELVIPEELKGAYIAFHNGDKEPLTQEEVENLAVHLRVMREIQAQREAKKKDDKT